MAREGFLYVEFLKLVKGFIEHNLAVQHLVNQGFKAGTHLHEEVSGSGI
jgi:hypothetical protein